MKMRSSVDPGKRAARMGRLLTVLVGCAVVVGCNATRSHVEKSLMADRGHNARSAGVAEHYHVACPDVLEVAVEGRPDLFQRARVDPDGRLDVDQFGAPRVEGKTTPEIAREIALLANIPPQQVQVRVSAYRSQRVFLFGQVTGHQRSLPYIGQETVLDLLQRAGGITPGAEPTDVHVIRGHITEGKRPEVFRVDLRAIVLKGDRSTNIRLQPFDQVHVGETREARLQRCIPPWLRPLWQALCDTQPPILTLPIPVTPTLTPRPQVRPSSMRVVTAEEAPPSSAPMEMVLVAPPEQR